MFRVVVAVLLFVITSTSALGLSCVYDQNPFILGPRPSAVCAVNSSANDNCYTYLSDPANSSEIWGGMPERSTLRGVGARDYYEVVNNLVHVEFSRDRLYAGTVVTGVVVCGTESFFMNFTPSYADFEEISEATIYLKDNAAYIVLAVFLVIFIIILLLILWGFRK